MTKVSPHNLDYRSLSFMDLVTRVVQNEDRVALEEIHSRQMFYSPKRSRLRLTEYLDFLRAWAARRTWRSKPHETADKAYEVTLDKFSNIPNFYTNDQSMPSSCNVHLKRSGPDCRLYLKAFRNFITQEFTNTPPSGQLDEELRVAKALQKFIKRHFLLSLLDAERNGNPFWSRYFWDLNGHKVCLWMPRFIQGHQRRKWLQKNIPDPDLLKPGERERIQNIINHKFTHLAFVPFDENTPNPENNRFKPEEIDTEPFCQALPQMIAEEKTTNIKRQRRAIQKLGEPKLKALILKIFESLDIGNTPDRELAREFGLSKATFSRFAGSHWNKSDGNTIPDLWQNTAQVLAMNPDFKDVVIAAGIWKEVRAMGANPNKK